jgi:hypothetical protein
MLNDLNNLQAAKINRRKACNSRHGRSKLLNKAGKWQEFKF